VTDSTRPVTLYLIGGREIRLGVDSEKLASAFRDALNRNEAIQVDDPADGKTYGINPRAILYWKPAPSTDQDQP
jgi:hypothetical protein